MSTLADGYEPGGKVEYPRTTDTVAPLICDPCPFCGNLKLKITREKR